MALKTVDFKIKVDGKELDLAKSSVNQFNEVYSAASKKLNDLPLGSAEWKKLQSELKNADTAFQQTKDTLTETEGKFQSLRVQIRQATVAFQEAEEKGDIKSMRKLKKDIDDLNDQFEITTLKAMKFEDALATMPGVAGFVGQSIQGIDKAFKVLVANPILALVTALVGAFMFLKEALGKTKEGTAALNKVSQAFSAIMGPLLALINTVAVPIFEKLALIITKVAGAFSFFAEKLGVSKASIAAATKDVDKVGQEAAENEKKRQEEAKARADKEAARKQAAKDKAIKDAADEKKLAQDTIKSNEDLEQSVIELIRAKVKASMDPIQALKDEQKEKDEDYNREKKRIEDLKKIKGTTAEEIKLLTIEQNNLEAAYLNDKTARDQKIVDETKKANDKVIEDTKKKNKELLDEEVGALNLKKAKGELTETQYQEELYKIQKKYTTDKKELNDVEVANEQFKSNQKKAIADAERTEKLGKLQSEMNDLDKKNSLLEFDFQQDLERLAEKRTKLDEAEKIELAAVENNEIERNKIKQKYSDQRKQIDEQEVNTVKAAEESKYNIKLSYLNAAAQFGNLLQQIAEDNKDLAIAGLLIEKAAALAVIAISAKKNFIKDGGVTSPAAWANLVVAGLSAAAVVFAAIKGVNDIKKAGSESGASGGGGGATSNGMGQGYATGGIVRGPGSGTSDSIPARLSNGEAVMTAQAVSMFGPVLSQMNQAGGGVGFNSSTISFAGPDRPKSSFPSDANQTTQIIKTYVVEGELTTAQQRQARLKDLSTI
jgi:DNA repair exonuclease SbcCD ATPase subunit